MSDLSDSGFDPDEQEFAKIVTDYADRAIRGEALQLEQACADHPKFEKDLRDLWGTIVLTKVAADEQRQEPLPSTSELMMPRVELPFPFAGYVLESEIGRGGMGIVYRATRNSDGEQVAIKMILKGDFASEAEKKRFDAEAEAAARMNHPNIVPIYEVGEFEGLKPSNILLDEDNVAYVADFGLAKQTSGREATLTKTGALLGTPSYMAPEQASGDRARFSALTDVYALGAILYHMLTGRPPFLGASPVDTVMMVLEQDPVAPRAINQRADRQLEIICMTCMQKPQDLRYKSAGELHRDVLAVQEGRPVHARLGRFGQIIGNLFRETHHAAVLENWGLIWMWHSLVLLVACLATEFMFWADDTVRWHYWLMWTLGLGTWAVVFWMVRRTMGPVTFVERQIAHVWAASMCCVAFLFPLEMALGLDVLQLAPLLGVVAGMVFLVKAGILSGSFYFQAVAMFATAIVMTIFPSIAMLLFGVSSGLCFFWAGQKYYRRRKSNRFAR